MDTKRQGQLTREPRLAIFGGGGLGIEMLALLQKRKGWRVAAILDKSAYAFDAEGLDLAQAQSILETHKEVSALPSAVMSQSVITDFLAAHAGEIDGIFYALPNLPNEFIPNVTKQVIAQGDFDGVIVDALKRTTAVEMLSELDEPLKQADILYITGCGATPGLLTSAAVVAAQSFVEIESVKITFGVGIANWQAYRATIREDIAHMPGYDVHKASQMTDAEVEQLLDERSGIIELVDMEHADDIMLELAGICKADQVTVGGIVDTRNPQKPISTNVQITGKTYQGRQSTHTFTLGDETSMAANVNGTVLGFLNAALHHKQTHGFAGFLTAADMMPKFAPVRVQVEKPEAVMAVEGVIC